MALRISRTQRQQLLDWAKEAEPEECCGLLLGNSDLVERLELTANVAARRETHFEIDPAALIAAEKAARRGGLAILGYFHSHPNGNPVPSDTDTVMAAADDRWWLIIAGERIGSWRPVESQPGGPVRFKSAGFV